MKLKEDVISVFKKAGKDIVYARSGDEVTQISSYGNVTIVQGKRGDRFPCLTKNLTAEIISNEEPLTKLEPIINQVQAKPVKRSKPAPLNKQNKLF